MRAKLLGALACLLVFSSCNYIPAGIDELMAAPRLNTRQAEVDLALQATLDTERVTYKYPLSGAYRSPFVFYDLDGNGADEAIIFYTHTADSSSVRAKVLRQTEPGVWVSAYDIAGVGREVDFIRFAHVKSSTSSAMIIGWQETARRGGTTLGVYSFENGRVEPEVQKPYTQFLMLEDAPDGLARIALTAEDPNSGRQYLSLYGKFGNRIAETDVFPLMDNVSMILGISRGTLWDGGLGLYIDQLRTDMVVATEIVRTDWQLLLPIVEEEEYYLTYAATFRERDVLSQDLNGDGVIEIPLPSQLPGYENGDEPSLVEYIYMPRAGEFSIAYRVVTNQQAGYYVFYPEKWEDKVTLVRQPESNEWRFCKTDPDTGQPTTDLLRIRRYAAGDYVDRFTEAYTLLEQRGAFLYYLYVPELADDPMALTEQEAREMIRLL